jgi:hypothetical protein
MFNAIWVNGGMPNSADLNFLASHQVYNLFWETHGLGKSSEGDNGVFNLQYTDQAIANEMDWIHTNYPQFHVYEWLVSPAPEQNTAWWSWGYPDLTTYNSRQVIIQAEVRMVQNCHLDGITSDLERVFNQTLVNYENELTVALHTANSNYKDIPEFGTGAGDSLNGQNPDNEQTFVINMLSQIHADYIQLGYEANDPANYVYEHTTNSYLGVDEALQRCLSGAVSPCLATMGYEDMTHYIQDANDEVQEYGLSSNLQGFAIYDYVGGLSNNPPSNQVYPAVDSPVTASDWQMWDHFEALRVW